jgi:signal transduction histidine kinase
MELQLHNCRVALPKIERVRPGGQHGFDRGAIDRNRRQREPVAVMSTDNAFVSKNDDAAVYIDSELPPNGDHPVMADRTAASDAAASARRIELAPRRPNDVIDLQAARISDVLHDNASQVLASIHMTIEDIAYDVPAAVQARLQRVRQHLHEVAEQLRRISHELHPRIVDDLGAVGAIRFIARTFARQTGVRLAIDVRVDECPAAIGAVVYRLVHEGLANIGAHARASAASITIAREGSRLVCTVCDDGIGFDAAALPARPIDRAPGLALIRARVEAAGGALAVTSGPQQGTCLRADFPLEI